MANRVYIHRHIDSCLQKTNLIVLLIISKWLANWNEGPSACRKCFSIATVLEWKLVQELLSSGVRKNILLSLFGTVWIPRGERATNIQDEVFFLRSSSEGKSRITIKCAV